MVLHPLRHIEAFDLSWRKLEKYQKKEKEGKLRSKIKDVSFKKYIRKGQEEKKLERLCLIYSREPSPEMPKFISILSHSLYKVFHWP